MILLTLPFLFWGCEGSAQIEPNMEEGNQQVEITACEAIRLAMDEASLHMDDPLVGIVHSTDDVDDGSSKPNKNSGESGKRSVWNISIGNPQRTIQHSYRYDNGVLTLEFSTDISDTYETGELATGTFTDKDIKVDSDRALQMAKEQKNLQPGDPDKYQWCK